MSILIGGGVLLGVLVFIHELGHFVVAKACGVRVLTFSLGFGPRLVGFKLGDTDYRLSLLPLGGYVRMYGDDIHQEIPEHEKGKSFLGKPIAQKAAIAFAGPAANFLLPVAVFFALAVGTQTLPAAKVGTLRPGEAAERAGLKVGDEIVRVDDLEVRSFSDLVRYVRERPGQKLEVELIRGGQRKVLNVVPKAVASTNPLEGGTIYGQLGIYPGAARAVLDVVPGSPAALAGLRSGDEVLELDGAAVKDGRELLSLLEQKAALPWSIKVKRKPSKAPPPAALDDKEGGDEQQDVDGQQDLDEQQGAEQQQAPVVEEPIELVVRVGAPEERAPEERAPEESAPEESAPEESAPEESAPEESAPAPPAEPAPWLTSRVDVDRYAVTRDEIDDGLAGRIARTRAHQEAWAKRADRQRGIDLIEGTLAEVLEGTAASSLGLKAGDRILSVDGRPIVGADEVRSRLQKDVLAPHVVGVRAAGADGKPSELRILVFRQGKSPERGMEEFRVFGAVVRHAFASPDSVEVEVGPAEAFISAVRSTYEIVEAVGQGLWMLVTGQVGLASLNGPITILEVAGQAYDVGWGRYIHLLCFISVNLGIVNLLPVPVLDGGYLLMFAIEAIRRRELELRTKELALKVGLVMLLLLMATAIVNDIIRQVA